jgi:CheY-like chemotaxis protein
MERSSDEPRPFTVLVVDDDPDLTESTVQVLALYGYAARVATTGEEALRAAEVDRPHVVLLDLVLPGIDGYEVARRLSEAADGRRPLLVAVSGAEGPDTRRRSVAAGIDLHLTKPVHPGLLVGVLDRFREFLALPVPALAGG